MTTYLMEHSGEAARLEAKTAFEPLERQARWAGLRPGMTVLDAGCGSGLTTAMLHGLVQPGGEAIGLDFSPERIRHAEERYGPSGARFQCADFTRALPVENLDFVWCRFALEYHACEAPRILQHLTAALKPGGILCAGDLDNNSLGHHPVPHRLEKALQGAMACLERKGFDPHMGRKLPTLFHDLDLMGIEILVEGHHVTLGPGTEAEQANWQAKITVALAGSGDGFPEYEDGFEGFRAEATAFFASPRRFTYSPLLFCRGVKKA